LSTEERANAALGVFNGARREGIFASVARMVGAIPDTGPVRSENCMLTDSDLRQAALAHLHSRFGSEWDVELIPISSPQGAWVKPRQRRGDPYTGGPRPFFIDRVDGLCTPLFADKGYLVMKEWIGADIPGAAEFFGKEPTEVSRLLRAFIAAVLREVDPSLRSG
jgi:hypothetical protein